jgi:hypothetical protein
MGPHESVAARLAGGIDFDDVTAGKRNAARPDCYGDRDEVYNAGR